MDNCQWQKYEVYLFFATSFLNVFPGLFPAIVVVVASEPTFFIGDAIWTLESFEWEKGLVRFREIQ